MCPPYPSRDSRQIAQARSWLLPVVSRLSNAVKPLYLAWRHLKTTDYGSGQALVLAAISGVAGIAIALLIRPLRGVLRD